MKSIEMTIVFGCLFFIIMILSGVWLGKTGKPYNTAVFTIHKLSALLTIIFAVILVLHFHKISGFNNLELIITFLAGLFFLLAFVTGALLSFEKTTNTIVLNAHKVMPILIIVTTVLMVYFLINQKQQVL